MPKISRSDYDAAVVRALDALPAWAVEALGDGVVRVEQCLRPSGLPAERGVRLVVYREPSVSRARDLAELARFARADLARAITWQLGLSAGHETTRALTDEAPAP